MHYTYILISRKDKRTYIGLTNNISRRLTDHNSGKVKSTKHRRPLILLHFEEFKSSAEAKKRELWWKSSTGRNYLKTLFSDSS